MAKTASPEPEQVPADFGPMFGQVGFFNKFAGQAPAQPLRNRISAAARRPRRTARRPRLDDGRRL